MFAAISGGEWAGVLATVVGFVLTLLSSLIAYIFYDLRREVRTLSRHVDSVMATMWSMIWRMGSVEEFLKDQGHRPPRIIPGADDRPDL